jgi:hypothetical protein
MRGESLFTWEGDDAAINKLSAEVGGMAAKTGYSDMAITDEFIREVDRSGLPAEGADRRGTIAWITYWLLHTDTHQPEHPGKLLDYAPVWDFKINLLPHASSVDVHVLAETSVAGVA